MRQSFPENRNLLVWFVVAVTIPVFLCAYIGQVVRYDQLRDEVTKLETVQDEWLDKNKKVLANISLFRSPERIEKLAVEDLDLRPVPFREILRVEIP
jgi:hypothetical protein